MLDRHEINNHNNNHNKDSTKKSVVPIGLTVGLMIFALLLSLAGYGFRLLAGDDLGVVVRHAVVVVSFFLIVVPSGFVAGAKLLNHFKQADIQTRNAWTLGLLTSCVAILSIMGRYS